MEVGLKSTGVCALVAKSTLDISNFLMEVAQSVCCDGRIETTNMKLIQVLVVPLPVLRQAQETE